MTDLLTEVKAAKRLPAPRVARAIREAAGVSQLQVARELGVHRMTVIRWERGESRPRPALRARWADLLVSLEATL